MQGTVELHEQAAAAAAFQAGVISNDQLVRILGWSVGAIRTQVDSRRWQRIHDGVYAVTTGELPIESLWWAAHLRCGDASALTGESALHAWRITDRSEPIEVVVPYGSSGRTPGLLVHRSRNPIVARTPKGLPPAVIPEVAVLAVSNRLDPAGVMGLMTLACQKRRVSADQIERAMGLLRVKHRKLILALLDEIRGGATTPLEIAGTRNILKAHGLPEGEGQVREQIGGRVVIRDRIVAGLIIEFDGRLGHADPGGRFRDQDRDNAAVLTGRPTLRFGWNDVYDDPCQAADQVAQVLSHLGTRTQLTPCSNSCGSRFAERGRPS